MKVPIEISARHVHLSQKDFERLFGKNKKPTFSRKLSQEEEFASEEKVVLINANNKIENVRVIGPFRKYSQLEISLTDAYNLRLKPLPKIKISGDVSNTTKILVRGPNSSIKIPCIIAKRHLHCSVQESKRLKLKNSQEVSMKIKGTRGTTFHNVVVRVDEDYKLSLHLDTDEGNSAGITGKIFGEMIK